MKEIFIFVAFISLMIGCTPQNNSAIPIGTWNLYGGPHASKEHAGVPSSKQIIYSGKTVATYRIYCQKSDVAVAIKVHNVSSRLVGGETIVSEGTHVDVLVKGQTIDVQGTNIEISLSMTSSQNISASGTYERIATSQKDAN